MTPFRYAVTKDKENGEWGIRDWNYHGQIIERYATRKKARAAAKRLNGRFESIRTGNGAVGEEAKESR